MENENKEQTIKNARNILIIIIIIFVVIALYMINRNNNYDKRIKEKLLNNNYAEMIEDIYTKIENNNTSQTNYTYNLKTKEFSKSITINGEDAQKHMNLTYKNKIVSITYFYKGIDGCTMNQEGTYKKDGFNCAITNNTTCKSQCDVMLKEAKNFQKEAQQFLK